MNSTKYRWGMSVAEERKQYHQLILTFMHSRLHEQPHALSYPSITFVAIKSTCEAVIGYAQM